MRYNPDIHHRRSIRLKGHDYSEAGAYFVTTCVQSMECLLGMIAGNEMILNEYGKIVANCWFDLPNHYGNIELDCHVIMPNHFHGIIIIADNLGSSVTPVYSDIAVGAGLKPAPTKIHGHAETNATQPNHTDMPVITKQCYDLFEIVRALKTFSARRINKIRGTVGIPVWQRNYYERIIRDKDELNRIRQYIIDNPKNWESDENYKKL